MARSLGRRQGREDAYYWPGFVDAMAQLLLVITFLMSVFMITQFLLSKEISGRDTVLSRLKAQIAELTQLLALEKSTKTELETSLAALTDDLQTARTDNSKLKGLVDSFSEKESTESSTITGLRGQLDAERKLSSEAMARVELLNQQIAALRRQIAALNEALEAAESRDQDSKTQIADLGRRLNVALAQRVQELARYRSEFFGRLRQILSQRSDIRVVGDRFVFQSEVLFPRARRTSTRRDGSSSTSWPRRCGSSKARSRRTSPGCSGSTVTPTTTRFRPRPSRPIGSCRRRAPLRW